MPTPAKRTFAKKRLEAPSSIGGVKRPKGDVDPQIWGPMTAKVKDIIPTAKKPKYGGLDKGIIGSFLSKRKNKK